MFSPLPFYYIKAARESVQLADLAEHFSRWFGFPIGFKLKLFDFPKDLKTQNQAVRWLDCPCK